MTFADVVNMIAIAAVLNGPSFFPGYRWWDEYDEAWSELLAKADAAGWR